jgi:hypothetical protein
MKIPWGQRIWKYFGMPRHGKFLLEAFINLPKKEVGDIPSNIQ